MDELVISVIIPVYNAERYLHQCLDSVLGQNQVTLEVIAVDDGSTDGSLDILREYEAKDVRVHVLTQKNQYAGAARNNGLASAKGKYVAFLDADDMLLPGVLSALLEQMEKHRLDMLKGGFLYQDEVTQQRYTDLYAEVSALNVLQRHRVLTLKKAPYRLMQVPDVPWNALYRRAFLDEFSIRFNGLRCVNDRSFYIDCLIHARRIMVTRKPIAVYRVGRTESLIGQKASSFACHLESYRIVRGLCESLSPELRQIVLQQELVEVLGWYERLHSQEQHAEELTAQLKVFIGEMDESDVGQAFLSRFSYAAFYAQLRGKTDTPKRPNLFVRMWYCWREHGSRYTWDKLWRRKG